ncbi:MAG TPA: hypothetical protein PKG52_01595 [bacterium]|nr:hypothetical protein [bacterium]
MKKLPVVFFLIFSANFLFADTLITVYELWLKTTEKPEKVNIGLHVTDGYGLLPECKDCEDCEYNSEDERCKECEEIGCGYPYGYSSYDEAAGEVFRGKFDDSKKLIEVVKINFTDYFDECVAPGYYEYILFDNFEFDYCFESSQKRDGWEGQPFSQCINFAETTVPEHSEICPAQSKVAMTQEEFESMKFVPYSDDDTEINDTESNDAENNGSVTDDKNQGNDVEIYDNEPEKSDTSNKSDSDGCSLLII